MMQLHEVRRTPISPPAYDNTHLGNISQWVDDNLAKLARYWSELGKALDVPQSLQENDKDMACWVRWQYDAQFGGRHE